jgi:hypothetical protein
MLPGLVKADAIGEFRAQYAAASTRLDNAYSHVKIVDTETMTDKKGALLWVFRGEYLRESELCRSFQTIMQSNVSGVSPGFERVFGGGAQKSFDIFKNADRKHFTFKDFGAPTRIEFTSNARDRCLPLFVTTCFDEMSVKDYIVSSNTHILSADKIEFNDTEVIDVVIDQTGSGVSRANSHYYFLPVSFALAGVTCPVLLKNESADAPHESVELRVSYEKNDALKMRQIDRWTGVPNSTVRANEHKYEIKSTEFGPIPADQFTLAALGVPEPVLRGRSRETSWFLLINGPLFLALGIFFAIAAHRRKRKATQHA